VFTWEFNTPELEREALELPAEGQAALRELMDALVFDPHEFQRRPGEPTGPLRTMSFGDLGLVSVHIYDPDRLVLIVQIQWLG
jgi:hypothetical protein